MVGSDELPSCEFSIDDLELKMELDVPAEISSIEPLVESVLKILDVISEIDDEEADDLGLALREALSNAIVHGAEEDADKMVKLCVACTEAGDLLMIVTDPGEGFDPSEVPSPVVGENIYSDSGRGIFLINLMMDEVDFDRGGTRIQMTKRLGQKDSSDGGVDD